MHRVGGAVVLANGLFRTPFAKTAHGLVRGPCRYRILGIVDHTCLGEDAGELLDGERRGIPFFESIEAVLEVMDPLPEHCVIGVATCGGVLPPELRRDLLRAAEAGISPVNGLHQLLEDDAELADICRESGARIIDLRKPRPAGDLRFWTGEALELTTPRIAVLGTDCAVGKRTTCSLLLRACRGEDIHAEMVYTGQTGWLQGVQHGFILDATPNDFVCGELEGAILDCQREADPDVILIEGQSALRKPSGPCGSELILAGGATGVILQHAPARAFFDDFEEAGLRIPPLEEEIRLIRLLGAEVLALTINEEGLTPTDAEAARSRLADELRIPTFLPLRDDLGDLAKTIAQRIHPEDTP